MKITVDRIENGYIVAELENGSFANLPCIFAPNAVEGDIIRIEIDENETELRAKAINEKMNRLFKD